MTVFVIVKKFTIIPVCRIFSNSRCIISNLKTKAYENSKEKNNKENEYNTKVSYTTPISKKKFKFQLTEIFKNEICTK